MNQIYEKMITWLSTQDPACRCILITGGYGSGKTTAIHRAIDKCGSEFVATVRTGYQVRSQKYIAELLHKLFREGDVTSAFIDTKVRRPVLVIEDVDLMMLHDKTGYRYLVDHTCGKLMKELMQCDVRIICTMSTSERHGVPLPVDLQRSRHWQVMTVKYDRKEALGVIRNLIESFDRHRYQPEARGSSGLHVSAGTSGDGQAQQRHGSWTEVENDVTEIYAAYGSNFRKIRHCIIKALVLDQPISDVISEESMEETEVDGITQATAKIFSRRLGREDIDKILSKFGHLMPMMIHENLDKLLEEKSRAPVPYKTADYEQDSTAAHAAPRSSTILDRLKCYGSVLESVCEADHMQSDHDQNLLSPEEERVFAYFAIERPNALLMRMQSPHDRLESSSKKHRTPFRFTSRLTEASQAARTRKSFEIIEDILKKCHLAGSFRRAVLICAHIAALFEISDEAGGAALAEYGLTRPRHEELKRAIETCG